MLAKNNPSNHEKVNLLKLLVLNVLLKIRKSILANHRYLDHIMFRQMKLYVKKNRTKLSFSQYDGNDAC